MFLYSVLAHTLHTEMAKQSWSQGGSEWRTSSNRGDNNKRNFLTCFFVCFSSLAIKKHYGSWKEQGWKWKAARSCHRLYMTDWVIRLFIHYAAICFISPPHTHAGGRLPRCCVNAWVWTRPLSVGTVAEGADLRCCQLIIEARVNKWH